MKAPRGAEIIVVKELAIPGDRIIIETKTEADFIHLMGLITIIYKLGNTYYLLGDPLVIYKEK